MKIAVSSKGRGKDSAFSPRFGRCAYFNVYDTARRDWFEIQNEALHARGGAGTAAVQELADHGVDVIISGRFGPHAFQAISAAHIKPVLLTGGSTQAVLQYYLEGEGEEVTSPARKGFHHGGRKG